MNLALIGMSGAGKSFIGRRVAERLSFVFLDIDETIERRAGQSLPEMLTHMSDSEFVRLESEVTIESTIGKDNLLISTGGSIIYAPEAMEHLSDMAKIAYLDAPYADIESRVTGIADRESRIIYLKEKGLKKLYEERVPLYRKYADITLDRSKLDADATIAALEAFSRG